MIFVILFSKIDITLQIKTKKLAKLSSVNHSQRLLIFLFDFQMFFQIDL